MLDADGGVGDVDIEHPGHYRMPSVRSHRVGVSVKVGVRARVRVSV